MSATAPARSGTSTPTGRTRTAMVALVGGAVALALGRLMTTEGGSPAERLSDATGQDARLTASMLLAIVGFAALMAGLLVVAGQVRARGSALATVGAGLTIAGCVAFPVLVSADATTLAATHAGSPSAMQSLLHQLDYSPAMLALSPLATLGYFVGPFLVCLAGSRAGFVPRWLPFAVLACLVLQPVAVAAGGPSLAAVVDSLFQLVFVVLMLVLARATVAAAHPVADVEKSSDAVQQPGTVANV